MKRTPVIPRVAWWPLVATILALTTALPAWAESWLSREGSEVVVSLSEEIAGIVDPDPGPRVEVFGDGRFRVHFPVYMKRAGDYEGQLSAAELAELLAIAEVEALRDFDAEAVRRRQAARARGPELRARPGGVHSRIGLRLTPGASARALGAGDRVRSLAWRDLRGDALRHSNETALSALGDLERRLRSLCQHPDLQPAEPKPTGTRR